MPLALLAPDIVEAILSGNAVQSAMLASLERPQPASWEEQRRKIFSASDDLSSPRPPSLLNRQLLSPPALSESTA
jgi:hypothetical protein